MLKLRLSMGGTKKRPDYKIVVADSRFPRDGRFIEKLGSYNPLLPKDKKERTLSLKPGLVSSTNTKNSRSPRVSTVVVESRRGRVSQTRKPVAPSVRVRKAPSAPNVFKPKKDDEKQIINYSNNLRSIISTPIGGTNEILENDTNGWTIKLIEGKYPSEKEIAEKIDLLRGHGITKNYKN